VSLTCILSHFLEKGELKEGKSSLAHLLMVGLELILLFIFFEVVLSGSKGPAAQASANMIVYGSLAPYFWVILIGCGLIIPFFFYVYNILKMRSAKRVKTFDMGLEDMLVPAVALSEEAATHQNTNHGGSSLAILICDGAVLLGGFALRCIIVFSAVPVWNGRVG